MQLLSSDDLWMYAPIAYNGMNIGLDFHINIPRWSSKDQRQDVDLHFFRWQTNSNVINNIPLYNFSPNKLLGHTDITYSWVPYYFVPLCLIDFFVTKANGNYLDKGPPLGHSPRSMTDYSILSYSYMMELGQSWPNKFRVSSLSYFVSSF